MLQKFNKPMDKAFKYTLELADKIYHHFRKNQKYNNVGIKSSRSDRRYSEDFLINHQNYNPIKPITFFVEASHITLKETAMQRSITLHYMPHSHSIEVRIIALEENCIVNINKDEMETTSVTDFASYYYNLFNNTQEEYEKQIISKNN